MFTTELPEPRSDIKLCSFDPIFNTNRQYICYKNEICCPNGCCIPPRSNNSYKYSQSWLFWLFILLFFVIYYLISWWCKKIEKRRRLQNNLRLHNSGRTSTSSSAWTMPRRYREGSTSNLSCSKDSKSDQPPKYHEAINMPKPNESQRKAAQVHVFSTNLLKIPRQHQTRNGSSGNSVRINLASSGEDAAPSYHIATAGLRNNIV